MRKRTKKIILVGQVVLAAAIIIFGFANCLRHLVDGNFFAAVCFAALGYVSGYLFLFRASSQELREYKDAQNNEP